MHYPLSYEGKCCGDRQLQPIATCGFIGLTPACISAGPADPAAGPISAYAFADVANGPGMELVLARLDGFIHVLDRNGKMIHTWATQGPVKDIRAWHAGDVVIAAAVGDSVRFYGRGGKEIGRVSGRAERLATLQSSDGSEILVTAGADGKVVAWTSRSISPR